MAVSLEAAPVNWGKQQVEGADIELSVTEGEREDNSGRIYGDVTSLTVTLRSGDPRVGNPGIGKGVTSVGEAAAALESEIFVIESPDMASSNQEENVREASESFASEYGLRAGLKALIWSHPTTLTEETKREWYLCGRCRSEEVGGPNRGLNEVTDGKSSQHAAGFWISWHQAIIRRHIQSFAPMTRNNEVLGRFGSDMDPP